MSSSSSSSSSKRCYYEILNLPKTATPDEIRTSYKKLALQRHPDKLISTGVSESDATSSFQELLNAYEVLSDAKERAWYDANRNRILFNDSSKEGKKGNNNWGGLAPDLFSFFSNSVFSGYGDKGKGFYKVYGDVFVKVYEAELGWCKRTGCDWPKEAPVFGNLGSGYEQVTAFYNYWKGFASSMDFSWADQFHPSQGPDRKSKRLIEEENKKLRKKAKREYNEMVRGLALFVKRRDKRVIDMQIKKSEEMERKREEEKQKKKEMERQKAEKARNYEEPDWAKIDEEEDEMQDDEFGYVAEEKKEERELYCVVCSKKFKSDKQWKNHEQSKKHKEKVAELKDVFSEEDREFEATEGNQRKEEEEDHLSADEVNELQEKFEETVGIESENSEDKNAVFVEEDEIAASSEEDKITENDNGINLGSDDDEASTLEAMLSGRKGRNALKNQNKNPTKTNSSGDELDFMEYNNTKVSRRNRGRRERGRRNAEAPETMKTDVEVSNGQAEDHDVENENNESQTEEPISRQEFPESDSKSVGESVAEEKSQKHPEKEVNKKSSKRKETVAKSKENVTKSKSKSKSKEVKGRQKAAGEGSDNVCDKCGQDFFSRTKLHKHLGETGHATIKSGR